jgi:hypothetical protein
METKVCKQCNENIIEEKMMVCWDCWFKDTEPNEDYRICKCGVHLHGSTFTNAPCKHENKEEIKIENQLNVTKWEPEWMEAYIHNQIEMALVIKSEEDFVFWTNMLREFKEEVL